MTTSNDNHNKKVVKWSIWLAHHSREECEDKCFKLGTENKKFYVCSRCFGLYPVMFLTVFTDLFFGFEFSNSMRALLFAVLVFPGWLHWSREAVKNQICISKKAAFYTAIPAGIGTGILLVGHFRSPYNKEFVFTAVLISLLSAIVVFLKHFFNDQAGGNGLE